MSLAVLVVWDSVGWSLNPNRLATDTSYQENKKPTKPAPQQAQVNVLMPILAKVCGKPRFCWSISFYQLWSILSKSVTIGGLVQLSGFLWGCGECKCFFSLSSKHLGDWILALHLASTLWLSSESHLCLTMMALETSNLFEGQSLCLHHHESKSELVDNANHFMVGDNFILSAVTKRHHKLLLILSSAPMITSQQILSSNEVAVDGDSWGSKSRSSNVVGSTVWWPIIVGLRRSK